jgi:hypothetical protein
VASGLFTRLPHQGLEGTVSNCRDVEEPLSAAVRDNPRKKSGIRACAFCPQAGNSPLTVPLQHCLGMRQNRSSAGPASQGEADGVTPAGFFSGYKNDSLHDPCAKGRRDHTDSAERPTVTVANPGRFQTRDGKCI